MEDSSANPYIPQESEAIRAKVYERQSPLGRIVKWSLIATVIVSVLVGGGLFFVVPRTTAVDTEARKDLANILQEPDQTLKRINVSSQLGFTLNYDNNVYSSYAEVGDKTAGSDNSSAVSSGQRYENNDLRVARAYNYVRIRPVESVDTVRALKPIPPQLEIFATVTDSDLVKAAKLPENKSLSKLSLFVKLDGDRRQAERKADDNTIVTIEATKPVRTSVGGTDYQKVRYATTNDNHRVSDVQYDECYYTIQYDQPYSICVSGVRPTNISAASLVEDVFRSVAFEQPQVRLGQSVSSGSKSDAKKVSFMYPLARFAQATLDTNGAQDSTSESTETTAPVDESESPLLTVTPRYYGDGPGLAAVAKTQPSVVRLGTLYCANIALKFQDGSTAATLTDACVGGVASGVFISKDGYIATTGHAIRVQKKAALNGYINFAADQPQMLDRLQRVLDYLLKAKLILQSDADYIMTGAGIGDQEALAKVENIASVIPDDFIDPIEEEYTYAVQPADKPIVINRSDTNKPSFAYSDTVLKAEYVASNYDASKSVQEEFGSATPSNDVGILKVKEGSFPDVPIAQEDTVKGDDLINIIGYPAYTDSSLTIDKIRNVPVVTTGKVEQVYEKDGDRLIQTDKPVLPGNDGAPVVDGKGNLVGFAVYGMSYCPDQLCFANGTVRTVASLRNLLNDKNIQLQTGSASAKSWDSGVDEYFKANYSASTGAFATAGSQYRFNRWADPLAKLASSKQGNQYDTSLMNTLQGVMVVTLGLMVVATVLLAVAFVLHRKRIESLQVGHYGAATPTPQPVQQVSPLPAGVVPPVQPSDPMPQPTYPTAAPAPAPQPSPADAQPVAPQAPVNPEPPVINLHGDGSQPQTGSDPQMSIPHDPSTQPAPNDKPMSGAVEDPFYK